MAQTATAEITAQRTRRIMESIANGSSNSPLDIAIRDLILSAQALGENAAHPEKVFDLFDMKLGYWRSQFNQRVGESSAYQIGLQLATIVAFWYRELFREQLNNQRTKAYLKQLYAAAELSFKL